jgi:hypothetical protein
VSTVRHCEGLQTRLDGLAARVCAETKLPGIVLGVSIDGRRRTAFAGTRVAGRQLPITASSRFELGCAAKLSHAMLAHRLARNGDLDLDAELGKYLPEIRKSAHARVRVAHLLSHTSGYRGTNILDEQTRSLDWHRLVSYLHRAPRLFEPGTVFSYEHTESVLLGEILDRVRGRSARSSPPAPERDESAHAGRHRFDTRTGEFVVIEKAESISAFWQAAFAERAVSINELLALGETALEMSELRRTVVRLPPTIGGPLRELLPVGFGLGSAELRGGFRGNTGISAGQCLGLRFDSKRRLCVAVALNAIVPYLRDFVLTALCRELTGLSEPQQAEPLGVGLDELDGFYIGPGSATVRVRTIEGRIVVTLGREDRPERLEVELAVDDDGRAVLQSPLPHLSLGFFRRPPNDGVALMLGLCAYAKRA